MFKKTENQFMKKIIFLLVLFAFCIKISAQNDTLKLSLKQAVQMGISNRFDVKASNLNIDLAHNNLVKTKKDLLPELSANGKINYYGQVQPSIIPAGYLGLTEPEKITIGMKNNTALAVDFNYAVYKPGLYTDIKIASNNLELEKEKNNQSDFIIKIKISETYENALLKSLQYNIAQKNENRYKEYYELAGGKYSNGAILESDMLLAELDYKNSKANTAKQKQNYLLSLQNLGYEINIPAQTIIILTDSLQTASENDGNIELPTNAPINRSEIRQLNIEQSIYTLQLNKTKQNYLPTLSLFANYTQLFQGADMVYSNSFYWAPVDYVGLKLSIPITANIKNTSSVNGYKLKLLQNELKLKQKTADVTYEIQDAITRLNNSRQNLFIAKDNYALSQKIYGIKKQQYDSGSFLYEKLLDMEKSIATSEQAYINATYDFLIAKINYQKAMGKY
jgi:outer membrane protein TolC